MRTFGPERYVVEQRRPGLSEVEEKLYKILVPENKSAAQSMDELASVYGAETVLNDKKLITERESAFHQDASSKRGELFEAILNDQIEMSNWLGETARTEIPSRFDDIINGVDSIVKFGGEDDEKEVIAMIVDITKSARGIEKKMDAVKSAIDAGRLSKIKYSHNIKEAVRVVVGADQKTIQDISELLLLFKIRQKHPGTGKRGEFQEIRKKLETHKTRLYILLELRAQLEAFADYAERTGRNNVAEQHRKILKIISDLLEEINNGSEHGGESHEVPGEDIICETIVNTAKRFGK
ncbi:MAG: hypothetical protein G01um101470_500 [Parcubacteria group bacterium Gr01-1014_70]|nr:MAG: hypothetical protein G01um101470_500 [Parcubacteria group bacterium Gr01-1014_70]